MTRKTQMISLEQLEQIVGEGYMLDIYDRESDAMYHLIERWENRLYEAIGTWKEEGPEVGKKFMKEVNSFQNKMMDEVEYPEILIDCLLSYFNFKIQEECFGEVLY